MSRKIFTPSQKVELAARYLAIFKRESDKLTAWLKSGVSKQIRFGNGTVAVFAAAQRRTDQGFSSIVTVLNSTTLTFVVWMDNDGKPTNIFPV